MKEHGPLFYWMIFVGTIGVVGLWAMAAAIAGGM